MGKRKSASASGAATHAPAIHAPRATGNAAAAARRGRGAPSSVAHVEISRKSDGSAHAAITMKDGSKRAADLSREELSRGNAGRRSAEALALRKAGLGDQHASYVQEKAAARAANRGEKAAARERVQARDKRSRRTVDAAWATRDVLSALRSSYGTAHSALSRATEERVSGYARGR